MKKLTCYKVKCKDSSMNTYEIGVMTVDEFSARHCAENSLFEGQHIKAKAGEVFETEEI